MEKIRPIHYAYQNIHANIFHYLAPKLSKIVDPRINYIFSKFITLVKDFSGLTIDVWHSLLIIYCFVALIPSLSGLRAKNSLIAVIWSTINFCFISPLENVENLGLFMKINSMQVLTLCKIWLITTNII